MRSISFCFLLSAVPALTAVDVERYTVAAKTDQWVERRLSGRNDTVPGEITTPYPTLIHLAVEWAIEGDDDLDGTVAVSFRRVGDPEWKLALPLRRVPGGTFKMTTPRMPWFSWANKHAGTLFDLEPGTEYEIALHLHDPDGGSVERTVRARTRPEPRAMAEAPIKKVTPQTLRDEAVRAQPGDVFLLAPGRYEFFHALRDGEPGRPIVFRADPHDTRERGAINDPAGGHHEFVLFDGFSFAGRKHVYLEGVLSTDTIDLFNAEDCVVRHCRVHAVWGIVSGWSEKFAQWLPHVAARLPVRPDLRRTVAREKPAEEIPPYSKNCLIADNVVLGVTPWEPDAIHSHGKNLGEGIEISGPGNVVCHNRVAGFRDCISLMEGPKVFEQTSIDIYNNDLSAGADDGIEADYSGANVRLVRNRITNCMRGIAVAPALGGPVYLVRNVLFNTENVWQFGRAGVGYVALHNTSVKSGRVLGLEPHGHAFVRNNLFFGADSVRGQAIQVMETRQPACDYDYNGYGTDFAVLDERGWERHGVRVGVEVFRFPVRVPDRLFPEQPPADLALRAGSAAVDAGERLPNINDAFTGRAPDLGALELGVAAPIYGPRTPSESNARRLK